MFGQDGGGDTSGGCGGGHSNFRDISFGGNRMNLHIFLSSISKTVIYETVCTISLGTFNAIVSFTA